jgi:DNA-binding MarR family transcriptional regulator
LQPHSTNSEKSSAENLKIIEIRGNVSLKQASEEILAYLKEHKEAETFDIANDLRLDLDTTVKVLKKLWEEGKVD